MAPNLWRRVDDRLTHARSRLASASLRLLKGPYSGLLPQGTTCSIVEILGDEPRCTNIGGAVRVCPPSVETYDLDDSLSPAFRREMAYLPRYVYTMRDVIVGIPTGVCLSADRVFLESFGNAFKWFVVSPPRELDCYSSVSTTSFGGPVTCLTSTTFYHFLLEEVPRLLLVLKERPDLQVLTIADSPDHIRSTIALLQDLGAIRGEVINLPSGLYRVPEYVFASAEQDSGFVRDESLRLLRALAKQVLESDGSTASVTGSKLFVSRRHASRSFSNEAEVEAMLAQRGFTVVYTENLVVREEMRLFDQAEVVVGSHGAGLSNIIWTRPGTKFVEIFSPRKFNDCYARLAASVQATYTPHWAQPDDAWGTVDLDSLAALLD